MNDQTTRGEGAHPGYSGQIPLQWDGTLTGEDIEQVLQQTGCKIAVRPRSQGKVRILTATRSDNTDEGIDEAVRLGREKIHESALNRIRLKGNGEVFRKPKKAALQRSRVARQRSQRSRTPPPPPGNGRQQLWWPQPQQTWPMQRWRQQAPWWPAQQHAWAMQHWWPE